MKCVMVVTPGEYTEMTKLTAPRAERFTGHKVDIIEVATAEDVWLKKLRLIEELKDTVLCLDADLVVCGWNWADFDIKEFNAVNDYNLWRHAAELNKLFPVEKAINAGLWLAGPGHASMFFLAEQLMLGKLKDHPQRFGDQTPINAAIHKLEEGLGPRTVHYLPVDYNIQVMDRLDLTYRGAKGYHVVGGGSWTSGISRWDEWKLQRVQECIERNPI